MLTCRRITELVTDFLERKLSWEERVRFRLHLLGCRPCRLYVRQFRLLQTVLKQLPAPPVSPDEVVEQLLTPFRAAARGFALRPPGLLRWLRAFEHQLAGARGWAVVLLLFALAGGLFFPWGREHSGVVGSLGEGLRCLLVAGASGSAAGVLLVVLASIQRVRLGVATCVVAALAGSLGGVAILEATCELSHAIPHVLLFHLGGMVLAAAFGWLLPRLPAYG
jgi:hypothetical protein